jgi:hypothetical protein
MALPCIQEVTFSAYFDEVEQRMQEQLTRAANEKVGLRPPTA